MREDEERLSLLEEMANIPELFGFSIPKMRVEELLNHTGKQYRFTYKNRDNPFLFITYDYYQKKVTKMQINAERQAEMERISKKRFEQVMDKIRNRIEEKHETISYQKSIFQDGIGEKTKELLTLSKALSHDILTLEKRDKVKESLAKIEAELKAIETEIETQRVERLKTTLDTVAK